MRILTIILGVLALSTAASSTLAKEAGNTLYAVKFHADWCGSCQAMAPQIAKARGKYGLDSKQVLFVKLDLTNKSTSNQANLMADAIGIGEFYTQNKGKTGFMLLVNSKTGETMGKITKEMKAEDIVKAIEAAL